MCERGDTGSEIPRGGSGCPIQTPQLTPSIPKISVLKRPHEITPEMTADFIYIFLCPICLEKKKIPQLFFTSSSPKILVLRKSLEITPEKNDKLLYVFLFPIQLKNKTKQELYFTALRPKILLLRRPLEITPETMTNDFMYFYFKYG